MRTVRVPAKLNLHLEILGRRDDGYHELRTLLQTVDLYDDLSGEATADGGVRLSVAPAGAAPEGEDNLVVAAARRLAEATGCRRGAALGLRKRIPAGAGLGGGSADAAAALVLLADLWGLPLDPGLMLPVAAELGADVPFFLVGGLALGVGRGDEVLALPDLPELGVVIVAPPVAVATAEVYRRLDAPAPWRRPSGAVYSVASGLVRQPCWHEFRNDLEPIVVRGWPEVAAALGALDRDRALRVGVTGSGSAVFGLYPTQARARDAASRLGRGYRVHVGVTVGRPADGLEVGGDQEGHAGCRSPR